MTVTKNVQILAISGSLRKASSNTAILHAATVLAPAQVRVCIYEGIGNLPLFNPDLEGKESKEVLDFRAKILASDGILIASPEYAHGITGPLKNALDWVVGSGEFTNKPVALLNASPRAIHAQASLLEIITVMAAKIIREASLTIPLPTNKIDKEAILANPELANLLQAAVIALTCAINNN
jgi:chromate reductase, NAD(P)H dehydrogenase (quinone)